MKTLHNVYHISLSKLLTIGLLSLSIIFYQLSSLQLSTAFFNDVDNNNPHYEDIDILIKKGVINGYSDGSYKPQNTVNRAEFTKIIVASVYGPDAITTPTEACFKDIATAAWYTPYICFAAQKEILNGYPDGHFRPDKTINLAEALKILFNAYNIPTIQFIREPDFWYEYFTSSLDSQFVNKTQINPFSDVSKPITRGQLASMIVYFDNKARDLNIFVPYQQTLNQKNDALIQQQQEIEEQPYIVDLPLVLIKEYKKGFHNINTKILELNSCANIKAEVEVIKDFPEKINIDLTGEENTNGANCAKVVREVDINIPYEASKQSLITRVTFNGADIDTIIHDTSLESENENPPIEVQAIEANEVETTYRATYRANNSCDRAVVDVFEHGYNTPEALVLITTTPDSSIGNCQSGSFRRSLRFSASNGAALRFQINEKPIPFTAQK